MLEISVMLKAMPKVIAVLVALGDQDAQFSLQNKSTGQTEQTTQ